MLLVEKYRPKSIREMVGNDEIIEIIAKRRGDLPHLLFTGPPGTGKTTLAHILKDSFSVLELNASDDRGIDVVRTKIKSFCAVISPRKLVILDECDSMTSQAQQALRRVMEGGNAKFILICNQLSKIIEPLQSRCAVLRFSKIPSAVVSRRVSEICAAENIKVTESGLKALLVLSGGDLRASLNILQGVLYIGKEIDGEFLYQLNGFPSLSRVQEIFRCVREKNVRSLIDRFEALWKEKHDASDIIAAFTTVAKNLESYEALRVIGKYHMRVVEGVASKLQFYAMFKDMMDAGV